MVESSRRSRLRAAPVAIEVRDISKTFRLPDRKVDTLKERVVHPLRTAEYRELRALRGITFDVHKGEFFGIVGRNGSGKSTLLKILASIYRADSGRIRMAGRLAPFIELGVGINPELTARENVTLNGVMMGLGRREAKHRLDSVLEFAELQEFVDLKLKNYSSGMMVRLAFAVMVEADADVMLVDEVLAVGDAAFGQKCVDVFRAKRDAGKSIVLVTHDMATVQAFCDRAMLIHDGEQVVLGEPEDAALGYYRLNFGRDRSVSDEDASATAPDGDGERPLDVPDVNVRLLDVWLSDADGQRVENLEQGTTFHLNVLAAARQPLNDVVFNFHCLNMDNHWVFAFSKAVEGDDGEPVAIATGERIRIVAEMENPLVPGRYALECWISRSHEQGSMAVHVLRLLDFFVYGTRTGGGNVLMTGEVETVVDPPVEA